MRSIKCDGVSLIKQCRVRFKIRVSFQKYQFHSPFDCRASNLLPPKLAYRTQRISRARESQ